MPSKKVASDPVARLRVLKSKLTPEQWSAILQMIELLAKMFIK